MRLLVILFVLIFGVVNSQKYIYHTKTYSYRDDNMSKNKWLKLPDRNMIIVFNCDTIIVDDQSVMIPTVSFYSKFYQEYTLFEVNKYGRTSNGDFSVDFIAEDILGVKCDFSYSSIGGWKYFIIHYPTYTLKYRLKKRVRISHKMKMVIEGEID